MVKVSKSVPFIASHLLIKLDILKDSRYKNSNKINDKKVLKTWSKSSTVLPNMIELTISVYNGKQHIPIFISNQLIGHKLGEFIVTRKFKSHFKSDKKAKR
uniref:Small ribosomal subunit protein uS19c n=1 Tax=Astrosyne radiata TaxID=1158023 RepID=A0A2U9NTK3_9STRA|nr:ribosomal protein S19 [Astrosyne radiata]AWT40352.1 ribosomal protein S19 [Astrosyne radiata]